MKPVSKSMRAECRARAEARQAEYNKLTLKEKHTRACVRSEFLTFATTVDAIKVTKEMRKLGRQLDNSTLALAA